MSDDQSVQLDALLADAGLDIFGSAITTDRIRINVNSSADGGWSRITEVEAWGQ